MNRDTKFFLFLVIPLLTAMSVGLIIKLNNEPPKIYNCTGSTRQEHFSEFLKICMTRSNGEYCVPAGKELYCNDEVWK